jgi:hypothetical protein
MSPNEGQMGTYYVLWKGMLVVINLEKPSEKAKFEEA